MQALTVMTAPEATEALPQIIDAAQRALAGARTSAEVLEARNMASFAYDAASRFTRRKAAFDHMTALAMRMQAQALRIEARAKERLADEYDAAQERGEVVGAHDGARKRVVDDNAIATATELGLRRDQVHEARRIRDAERADPGAIDRAIDARLAQGDAPTRAALKRDLGIAGPITPTDPAARAAMMRQAVPLALGDILRSPLAQVDDPECEAFRLSVDVLRGLPRSDLDALRRCARALTLLVEAIEHDPEN